MSTQNVQSHRYTMATSGPPFLSAPHRLAKEFFCLQTNAVLLEKSLSDPDDHRQPRRWSKLAAFARHSALARRVWRCLTHACGLSPAVHGVDIPSYGSPRLRQCCVPSGLRTWTSIPRRGTFARRRFLGQRIAPVSRGSSILTWIYTDNVGLLHWRPHQSSLCILRTLVVQHREGRRSMLPGITPNNWTQP